MVSAQGHAAAEEAGCNPGRVVPVSPDLEEPEEEEAGCGAWRSWLRGAPAAEAEPSGKSPAAPGRRPREPSEWGPLRSPHVARLQASFTSTASLVTAEKHLGRWSSACKGSRGTDGGSWGANTQGGQPEAWRWVVVVAAQECECSKCQGTAHIKMVKTANFVFSIFY